MFLFVASLVALIAFTGINFFIGTKKPRTWVDLTAGALGLLTAGIWIAVNAPYQGAILLDTSVIKFGAYDLAALPLILLSALLVGRTGFMMEARSTVSKISQTSMKRDKGENSNATA